MPVERAVFVKRRSVVGRIAKDGVGVVAWFNDCAGGVDELSGAVEEFFDIFLGLLKIPVSSSVGLFRSPRGVLVQVPNSEPLTDGFNRWGNSAGRGLPIGAGDVVFIGEAFTNLVLGVRNAVGSKAREAGKRGADPQGF